MSIKHEPTIKQYEELRAEILAAIANLQEFAECYLMDCTTVTSQRWKTCRNTCVRQLFALTSINKERMRLPRGGPDSYEQPYSVGRGFLCGQSDILHFKRLPQSCSYFRKFRSRRQLDQGGVLVPSVHLLITLALVAHVLMEVGHATRHSSTLGKLRA